jgi:hypothetical protein
MMRGRTTGSGESGSSLVKPRFEHVLFELLCEIYRGLTDTLGRASNQLLSLIPGSHREHTVFVFVLSLSTN